VGELIGVGANLGVLIGLVVLIFELGQNTSALLNETDVAIANIGSNQASLVVQYPELAELLVQAETEDWSSFSKIEQLRLGVFWSLLVDRLELQFRLFNRNDEVLFKDTIVFPVFFLKQNSFRSWWKSYKASYQSDFVIFFEALINNREQ
jgi:hypothetical protein